MARVFVLIFMYFMKGEIMKNINIDNKFKNPYFWLSVIALIFSASGVDFNQLTSWKLLGEALLGIVNNPVSVVAVITALLGIWNDNSTKGMDKPQIKKVDK